MPKQNQETPVYLICFHSQPAKSLADTKRQFRVVESAILRKKWPYDNGDDPSFYVASEGGLLTWGVCRPDVRNSIPKGSLVVWFSFTELAEGRVLYRICAVTSVADKVDVRAVGRDKRFARFRRMYINALVHREKGGWRYDETDRPESRRHGNWLWRIAEHRGMWRNRFKKKYSQVYRSRRFSDLALKNCKLTLGKNYIVFSVDPSEGYISPYPPEVAIARKGDHEQWSNKILKSLTVGTAAKFGARHYLRVANKSHRNVHRHIRFAMPSHKALAWRDKLIAHLREASEERQNDHSKQELAIGVSRC